MSMNMMKEVTGLKRRGESQILLIPLFSQITGVQNCQNVLASDVALISYFYKKMWHAEQLKHFKVLLRILRDISV